MSNKLARQLEIIKKNKDLNFSLAEINYKNDKKGILSDLTFCIKDNINFFGSITTGGSKFLENYESPYNATIIELLLDQGATPLCKTNMDEFGLGGTGLFSGYGDVINPIDSLRISGGSSSGSAVAVQIDACDFSIGTDTGDSIRKPASFMGVIGYKPTYGIISRYGVLPYSPSLDHVGLFSKKIDDIFKIMKVIGKYDEKDFTSQTNELIFDYNPNFQDVNVAIVKEVFIGIDKKIKDEFDKKIKLLKLFNFSEHSYDQVLLDLIPLTYKIITYSEAVSCYQNMSTVTFGPKSLKNNFESSAIEQRSQLFGAELKRRFLIGAHCTSNDNYKNLFLRSAKVRTKIINEYNKILENNKIIITIGSSNIAPLVFDVKSKNVKDLNADIFLQVANFGGFPSITIPFMEINNNPIGINISGQLNDDAMILSYAKYIIETLKKGNKHV